MIKNTRDLLVTQNGTPYYMAPELFAEKPYQFEADIWSLGVLLYEMCALEFPFRPEDFQLHSLAKLVRTTNYKPLPSHFSDELHCLVHHLLNKDPKKRPNINQLFANPAIKDTVQKVLEYKTFKDEFTHTLLHGVDVFAEMKEAKKR